MIPLEREFEFFLKNQKVLVEKYKGKYVVIKNEKILGAYDTLTEAVEKTSRCEELGTFLVQKCVPTRKAYVQTYHSRVALGVK